MADSFLYDTTAGTLNQVNLAESVEDVVTNLFPLETPLQTQLGSKGVRSVYHRYPIDTFTNITRTNALFAAGTVATNHQKPEGHTPTTGAPTQAGQLAGVVEIHVEAFGVTGTMRAVSLHGFGDMFVEEAAKYSKKVANDEEMSFTWSPGSGPGGNDLESGGGTTMTRQTQGLAHWIGKTGLQRTKIGTGTGITDGNGNVFHPSTIGTIHTNNYSYCLDANGANLDRDMFFQTMLAWRNIGGEPDRCFGILSSNIKQLFVTFALLPQGAINERKVDADIKTIYDTIDVYVTDMGTHYLSKSRYLDIAGQSVTMTQSAGSTIVAYDECAFFIMPKFYKIGSLRGQSFEMLAHTGDHHRGQILSERGLFCQNTLAGCGIVNCKAP